MGTEQDGTGIRLVLGNITAVDVDAIVTAANRGLLRGGGVDGAVHAAAGSELLVACRGVAPCPTGEARITEGYNLRAKHVIHAVGPIYSDGLSGEPNLLRSAYLASFRLASEKNCKSIAFPCISTGVYGYPKEAACHIAVDAVTAWLEKKNLPQHVTLCCYDHVNFTLYEARLHELGINPV